MENKKEKEIYLWSKTKKIYLETDGTQTKLFIDEQEYQEFEENKTPKVLSKEKLENTGKEQARSYYQNALKNYVFSNLVILSGAGSSVKIGSSNDGNGGLTMGKLWEELNQGDKLLNFNDFTTQSGYDTRDSKGELIRDLEKLLDAANRNQVVHPELSAQITIIKKFLIKKCTLELGESKTHETFLRKITKRKMKDSRVKLFTLNYDSLWEQAANKDRFTIIDGFNYASPRYFDGQMFDYDIVIREGNRIKEENSFVPKLFHLYKVHGSLNWYRQNGEIVQKDFDLTDNGKNVGDIDADRLIVFPSDNKYEQSYEQPYFEMMSRFQRALRLENTLLITIGFSFLDKHISSVIEESLKQNSSLNLVVVDPSISIEKHNWERIFRYTKADNRTLLVGETFQEFAQEYPDNNSFEQEDLGANFARIVKQALNH
ncbi:SIR2 family protein [Runella aurantiaca]|uniref:SIR2 family protein n=1 Tax=Runella aurantiaca TaxID=2282308 RepID=A0A369IBU7_9BACT|nr:SIR2 family protein [Runella aurantiaca]RDB05745.1 SIR2 family protein [Runella aurantiaca]